MNIKTVELKFLLRLLAYPGYRSAIAAIQPNPKTKPEERNAICRRLAKQGWVEYTEDIKNFIITPAGRMLLGLDTTSLPVTPDELAILRACSQGVIAPGKVSKVSPQDRQRLIRRLVDRGLVKASKVQILEVWLTEAGQQWLRDEYQPQGHAPVLSLAMLGHYLALMRQGLPAASADYPHPQRLPLDKITVPADPSLEDILHLTQTLDQSLGTGNFLPIFHLRSHLQPPLTRDEVDQRLYQLQRNDKIELSSLQDVTAYHEAELAAGIPQDIGGSLFFISIVGDGGGGDGIGG